VEQPRFTWDGLPVAPDEPHGAAIVVRRPAPGGDQEYLVLHRAHQGPGYEGDWAWTPPSGSRLPGEPVLPAALRELAEESGLRAAQLRPVDLGGIWAVFALDVAAGTRARVDAEHDRLEWVSLAEALARCKPDAVAAGLRQAARTAAVRLEFCPAAPAGRHLVVADDRARGYLRHYPAGDAIGIECAVDPGWLDGAGRGPQLIWQYVQQVVLAARPGARRIVAAPDRADPRLARVLEQAAFRRVREVAGDTGAPTEPLWALDVIKFFGELGVHRLGRDQLRGLGNDIN
jgi:8-oxo-dGTP pyrophosphatase MutT (NUDIX family)